MRPSGYCSITNSGSSRSFNEHQRQPVSCVRPYAMADSWRTKNYATGRHRNCFLSHDYGPLSCDDMEDFILAGMQVGDCCLSWFVTNQFGDHVFRSDQLFPDLLHWGKFQQLHDLKMFHCGPPTDSLWDNTVLIKDNVVERIRGLKQQDGPDQQVPGSSRLLQTHLKHDLVDELRANAEWCHRRQLRACRGGEDATPAGPPPSPGTA